jgi:Protein of unknown function (DUF4199)
MTETPSASRIALKWGAFLGLALMLYSSLIYTADLMTKSGIGGLSYVLIVGGLILAMREFRTANGGFMTFGQGMSIGALVAAVSGLLSSLYSVFYTSVIDPGLMGRVMEQTRSQFEEQGKLTDEQIEQTMEIMKIFQNPAFQIFAGVFGSIIIGLLLSLIVSAVMRRQNPNPLG